MNGGVEAFGLELGSVFQGGTFAAVLAMLAIVVRAYIIGIPERTRAENEGRQIDNAEVALRFKEWRAEVHGMKNDLAVVTAKLHQSDAQRARNRDRFNMVLFVLQLVMTELRRLDPGSAVIKQAEVLLKEVCASEEKDQPDAESAARATVAAAEETLTEVTKEKGS
jgi:hypothetical protein